MLDMLGKLNEVKKKMDEIKNRLDTITVEGNAGDGAVQVIVSGNRVVKSINIETALLNPERKEELQDLLEIAMNNALEKAQNISESEMQSAGKGLLPNIPGLL
ncbi:MAG TPA: YbaB/EbfC family nucleoid-associated protein [Bacteroidia bacterium]|nr:YbaB/EbfC family nucleoid-associated protein [Bacteroidia bacterium]